MLLMLEVGREVLVLDAPERVGRRARGLGTVEGAVFRPVRLMVSIHFFWSGQRALTTKRIVGCGGSQFASKTAYLRVHLLSPQAQPAIQELFRRYVDSRLETYRKLPNMPAAETEMAKSKKIQERVWNAAEAATRLPDSHPSSGLLLLPALNNMIDIATTRTMALQIHPPRIVYALLFGLGLICSLLAGFRMSSGHYRSWLHILGFTVLTVIIVT
jgi:hypothetical protein